MRGGGGNEWFRSRECASVISPTTPGGGRICPGPAGSANANSAFQPAAGPFVQNPQAAVPAGVPANQGTGTGLAGLPASAFTTQVARPTPPGPTSKPLEPVVLSVVLAQRHGEPIRRPERADGERPGKWSVECRPRRPRRRSKMPPKTEWCSKTASGGIKRRAVIGNTIAVTAGIHCRPRRGSGRLLRRRRLPLRLPAQHPLHPLPAQLPLTPTMCRPTVQ